MVWLVFLRSLGDLGGSAVAWGYIVPNLSSLSFSFFCFWCARVWWGFAWDVSSLCGVCARVFSSPLSSRAPASFFCPAALFCHFVACLVVSLSSALLVCLLFSSLCVSRPLATPPRITWTRGKSIIVNQPRRKATWILV